MQLSRLEQGIAFGLTDTDDARVAVSKGDPVEVIYPDQGEGGVGTLVIPNTVALVRGGRHAAEGERLLRWLVSADTEKGLAAGPIANIPLRPDVPAPAHVKRPGADFRPMSVDWDAVGANRDRWNDLLQTLFAGK
jgi:iron(III) transport system substrate-binding protein